MLTSGNDEQLEFVGRQLSYMAKRPDFNLDAALEKLHDLGNANLREAVARIKQPADRQVPTSNTGLFFILKSSAPGVDVGGVITEYMAIKKRLEQDMAVYIAALRGSLIYNLVLLVVAMLLCSIFKEKVATTLQSFFGKNVHQLPDFTAFMLTHGSQYGLVVLSLIFLVICVIGATLFKVHQDVVHFRYPNIGLTWLLAGTSLLTVANTYVLLAYMKLLIKAGHLPDEAEAMAPRMAGFGVPAVGSVLPGDMQSQLTFAKHNDTYADELAFQLDQAPIRFIQALSNFRSIFNTLFQILIYILVGGLMIGYYLPIFEMGSNF